MAAKYSIVPEEKGIITKQFLKNLSDIDDGDYHFDIVQAKVVSIIVLGLGSFLLGLLPLQLAKWLTWKFNNSQTKTNNLVISLLLCFGGGVLMFTTFIHLQPEVREEMEILQKNKKAPEFDHFTDLVFCLGFFFVYFIEEVVHYILDRKHHHSEDETCIHRTVSLRKCSKTKDSNCDQNEGIIPRVSLNQGVDEKSLEMSSVSTSTQVLIDSSKISSIYDNNGNTSFEENYPTKPVLLNSEAQITPGKLCLFSEYPETKEKSDKDSIKKNFYEKNCQPIGKSSPKNHSHVAVILGEETMASENYMKFSQTFRGFFTVLALSFHAVFEGLAVGLENEVSKVWYLFLAIATHKFVISFCVGVDLMSTRTKLPLIILYLGTFAFVTPLGIGIGLGLSNNSFGPELSTVILQGMAAGTLLYVVFFEVLQRERANEQSGILQLMAILAGFAVMMGLQLLSGHHDHHHDHHHDLESFDLAHLSAASAHFNEPTQKHFMSSHKH